MNILIIIHSLACGGAERETAHLARLWASAGDTVTVATISGDEPFNNPAPSVRLERLGLAGPSHGPVDAILSNLRRIRAVRALIRRVKPDVTIGMMDTSNMLVACAALGLPTAKLGVEHNYAPAFLTGGPRRLARKLAYRFLDGVASQTTMASSSIKANTLAPRVFTIPNSVQWPLMENPPALAPEAFLSPSHKVILSVGRLHPVKGHDKLIEAFSRASEGDDAWRLVILGEGSERPALEQRVRELGLDARILLPGLAGNLNDWYERASIFAMSSVSEGFPMTLLEALAAGVPAVSFDCDAGPREIIRHGQDGLLVAPGDVAALAGAMKSLMNDDALRAQMADQAQAVRERFSERRVLALWDDVFAAIAAAPKLAYGRPL
jgi:glycosyltransferase involved in cell wall biosynthesis